VNSRALEVIPPILRRKSKQRLPVKTRLISSQAFSSTEEQINLHDGIAAFNINGAYVEFQEDATG
jgi:hypothetical protein